MHPDMGLSEVEVELEVVVTAVMAVEHDWPLSYTVA